MLGKELRSSTSGIWISYAIPIDELLPAYRDILDGKSVEPETSSLVVRIDPTVLGVVLLPDLLDKTPPFVESILPDSPAARADVRADDLVVAVGLDSVGSRISMSRALGRVPAGDPIQITVVRNGELIDLDLGPLPDTKKAARQ
jgi:serine protease Do